MPYDAANTTKTSRQFFSFLISNPMDGRRVHRRTTFRLFPVPTHRHANPRLMVIVGLRSPPASSFLHLSAFALPHFIATHPSRSSNPTGAYVLPRTRTRRILSLVSRRHGWATRCVCRFSYLPLYRYPYSHTSRVSSSSSLVLCPAYKTNPRASCSIPSSRNVLAHLLG